MNEARWKDLKKRTMVSSLIIGSVVFLLYFSQIFWMRPLIAFIVLGIVGLATAELVHFRSKEKDPWTVMGAVFVSFSLFLSSQHAAFQTLPFFVFFFSLLFFFLLNFSKIKGALERISFSLFSLIYLAIPLGLIFLILYTLAFDGRLWVAYLLMVTKMSDIGAYFGGTLWGKRKLAPLLSPKKTWEGAIVGGALGIGVSLLFSLLSAKMGHSSFDLSWKEALILGALMSFFGQVGDLAESLLKREAGIKDSSRFPGLGGILDMVDSLLLATPLLYLFLISR